MRLGKDLENKPIISVTDGRMLGRAKDVYVDAELLQLAGLYLGTEGMIRRRPQVIPSTEVVLFGIDVILVKDTDVVTDNKAFKEVDEWRRLKDLQGYEVHTPGGTKLGTVGDVILDENGGIVGLSLARVFVKGPLAEQGTVQREVIVSSDHKEELIYVDLAMLEGMVGADDEKTPVTETPTEEPEEIVIDVVDIEEEPEEAGSEAEVKDLDEPANPEVKPPAEDAPEADDGEQE